MSAVAVRHRWGSETILPCYGVKWEFLPTLLKKETKMKILSLELEIEDDGKRYKAVGFRKLLNGEIYLYSDYWKGVATWEGDLCFHEYIVMEEVK